MSTEDKISWIEKILDKNTNTIESLSKEITKIDTYFKIAFGVATVLGISGVLIYSNISTISNNIKNQKNKVSELEEDINELRDNNIEDLKRIIEKEKNDAKLAIQSVGNKQKADLSKFIKSITPSKLADEILKDNIKNILVKNCGNTNNCPCPSDWEKASIDGGNGDLNEKAKGDYIYICVQYY